MKTVALASISIVCIFLMGCDENYYYITVKNRSSKPIYSGEIDAWRQMPNFSPHPDSGGGTMGVIKTPVPDEITFTWKTALPGGEEHLERNESMPPIDADGIIPSVELYPKDKFKDHKATVVLRGKVPKHLKGEIIFVIRNNEKIDVSYVEKSWTGRKIE